MFKHPKLSFLTVLLLVAILFLLSRYHESVLGLSSEEWSGFGSWFGGIGILILTGFLVYNDTHRAQLEVRADRRALAAEQRILRREQRALEEEVKNRAKEEFKNSFGSRSKTSEAAIRLRKAYPNHIWVVLAVYTAGYELGNWTSETLTPGMQLNELRRIDPNGKWPTPKEYFDHFKLEPQTHDEFGYLLASDFWDKT